MTEYTRNEVIITALGSKQVLNANPKRKGVYISNYSGATKTIAKGDVPATAGAGIVLLPNATYYETDSEGFQCFKGAIQIYDSGAGSVAIAETTETGA